MKTNILEIVDSKIAESGSVITKNGVIIIIMSLFKEDDIFSKTC